MKARRHELEAESAALGEAPKAITLHPATIERYLTSVDRLATDLASYAANPHTKGTVVADLRALIHSVTVHAHRDHRLEVEVKRLEYKRGSGGPLQAYVSAGAKVPQ